MTPLQFAQRLARQFEATSLPKPVHAQLGELQVPCEGTYVTALTQSYYDPGGGCGLMELTDLVIIAARDCSNVANDDGTTDWAKQDAVSAASDSDAAILREIVEAERAEAVYRTSTPTTAYLITGGLSMVTVLAQLPVP